MTEQMNATKITTKPVAMKAGIIIMVRSDRDSWNWTSFNFSESNQYLIENTNCETAKHGKKKTNIHKRIEIALTII